MSRTELSEMHVQSLSGGFVGLMPLLHGNVQLADNAEYQAMAKPPASGGGVASPVSSFSASRGVGRPLGGYGRSARHSFRESTGI